MVANSFLLDLGKGDFFLQENEKQKKLYPTLV